MYVCLAQYLCVIVCMCVSGSICVYVSQVVSVSDYRCCVGVTVPICVMCFLQYLSV